MRLPTRVLVWWGYLWPGRRPTVKGKPLISRWDWYVDPHITIIRYRLTGRCISCGLKLPTHKLGCAYRERTV